MYLMDVKLIYCVLCLFRIHNVGNSNARFGYASLPGTELPCFHTLDKAASTKRQNFYLFQLEVFSDINDLNERANHRFTLTINLTAVICNIQISRCVNNNYACAKKMYQVHHSIG